MDIIVYIVKSTNGNANAELMSLFTSTAADVGIRKHQLEYVFNSIYMMTIFSPC